MESFNVKFLKNAPTDVILEVLPYICNDAQRLIACDFRTISVPYNPRNCEYLDTNYKSKYKTAMYDGIPIKRKIIINNKKKNLLLSRVYRKNGKHRYYITVESYTSESVGCDCGYYNCRDSKCGSIEEYIWFYSYYAVSYTHLTLPTNREV